MEEFFQTVKYFRDLEEFSNFVTTIWFCASLKTTVYNSEICEKNGYIKMAVVKQIAARLIPQEGMKQLFSSRVHIVVLRLLNEDLINKLPFPTMRWWPWLEEMQQNLIILSSLLAYFFLLSLFPLAFLLSSIAFFHQIYIASV